MTHPVFRILLLAPAGALGVLSLLLPSSGGGLSAARIAFVAVYFAALVAAAMGRSRGARGARAPSAQKWRRFAAPLLLLAGTFLLPASNALIGLPFLFPLLHVARISLAALLLAEAVNSVSRAGVSAGSALLSLLVADAALVLSLPVPNLPAAVGYRRPVDPAAIPEGALVAIGDSFVWGSGVDERDTWVAIVGRNRGPIVNLGLRGAGPSEYLATLRRTRRVRRIVLAFFPNDLAPLPSGGERLRQALLATGKSSAVCRLLGDLTGAALFPTRAEYEAQIVASWNEKEPSFPSRWETFASQFVALTRESRAHSEEPPLFVLFPLLSKFDAYPLRSAHERIAALARTEGVELLDFLPLFAVRFPDGEGIRVEPNDTHFDARAHAYVAEEIEKRLR